jgi:hypothetical protein
MKKILFITALFFLATTICHSEDKKEIYILPFIITIKNADNDLSAKTTEDFRSEFKKLGDFQVAENDKVNKIIKDLKIEKVKEYSAALLEKISEKTGNDLILYGIVSGDENKVSLTVKIYSPENKSEVFNNTSTGGEMLSKLPAGIPIDLSLKIKFANMDLITSISNYKESILSKSKNNNQKDYTYKLTKEELLSILKKYSPDGYTILTEVERLSKGNENIIQYLEFKMDMSTEINTDVHEECHLYNNLVKGYFIDAKETIKIKNTENFPSKEIIPEIPAELITFRFEPYINNSSQYQSTQTEGIYGLLDEFDAYYQGTKVSYDLLGYCKENLFKNNSSSLNTFLIGLNGTYFAYYEFKYFIYTYLLYAKEKHPAIFKKITANNNFITAFNKINERYLKLAEKYPDMEKEVKALTGMHLNSFSDTVGKLTNEMKKDKYIKLEKEVFGK